MTPNTLLNSMSFAYFLCIAVIAVGSLSPVPSGATSPLAQGNKTPGFCVSEPKKPEANHLKEFYSVRLLRVESKNGRSPV